MVDNVEEDEILDVEMPCTEILKAFSIFNERGIICFFTGKNHLVCWVAQWLNAMVGRNTWKMCTKVREVFLRLCFEPKNNEIDYYHVCRFSIIVI